MAGVEIIDNSPRGSGSGFIPDEFLPAGKDENYLRNEQSVHRDDYWRPLRSDEIEIFVRNGNRCDSWDNMRVADPFDPKLVKNSEFVGLVRIGKLENITLGHHDLQMPTGITNSRVVSCDLGDNVAVHNVRHLAHYIIAGHVILLNIDEMLTTNRAKFGNGIIKDGEVSSDRFWIDIANENGGRAVAGFDGMIPADAYIWAKYRDDEQLISRLVDITQKQFDSRRGFYGSVGTRSVIKNSRSIKDVKVGECCYIKGANKLKNLTINSTDDEPTQIGEGVELVNGIISPGCRVFYGCKAVRFVMCRNTSLKYGARLLHSVLGDNSTVSCCELLNNLIFPAHEQHHNNSFLIASIVMGQSNLPAGASIGSNHNSRACDGEVVAGRGFWPGLATSIKHSCKFASFVLLAKGDYPAELNVPLPFSLLSNDISRDRLVIMPAYWWMYNMYALARNSYKYRARDVRKIKTQHIEFDSLAPDTIDEIIVARKLLEKWAGRAYQIDATGSRKLLSDDSEMAADVEIVADGIENSSRKTVIIKTRQAYQAYGEMLIYYAIRTLLPAMVDARAVDKNITIENFATNLQGNQREKWVNLGGMLARDADVKTLLKDVKSADLDSWDDIHARYDDIWSCYEQHKINHSMSVLLEHLQVDKLTDELWEDAIEKAVAIAKKIADRVNASRSKDFAAGNPFRKITFDNDTEMRAVLGSCDDDAFIKHIQDDTEKFIQLASKSKS